MPPPYNPDMLGVAVASLLVVAGTQKPALVYDVAASPDGRHIAITIADDKVRLYRLADGKLERTLQIAGAVLLDLEYSPDGKRLAVSDQGFRNGYAPIWDTQTWKEVVRLGVRRSSRFTDPPAGLEYAGSGKWIMGQPRQGRDFVVWDATTGNSVYSPRAKASGRFRFAVAPEGTLVALGETGTPTLRFWDFGDGKLLREWGSGITEIGQEAVRYMRFSNDGLWLCALLQPRPDRAEVWVFRADSGRARLMSKDALADIQARDIEWSPDNRTVYIVGLGGKIVAYDASRSQTVKSWTGHGGRPIKAVTTAKQGRWLVTAGDGVSVWDARTSRLVRTITITR